MSYSTSFKTTLQVRSCQILFKRHAHNTNPNYYTVLGLTNKATQADIKKAYYELSKKHHPDRAEGSQNRFQEIVSAYEILGNAKLRTMYDLGQITHGRIPPNPMDIPKQPPVRRPVTSFDPEYYKRHMPTSGRTSAFNYDEWQRNHYSDLRQRDSARAQMLRQMYRKQREYEGTVQSPDFYLQCFLALLVLTAIIVTAVSEEIDRPRPRPKRDVISKSYSNEKDDR